MILRPLLSTPKAYLPPTLRPITTSKCQSWRTRPPLPLPGLTRPFTSTSILHDDQNHYDVLGVSTTISPPDLKKRFYVLSRETHPDLHPKDPSANARFQSISESYSIISDPEKRRRYDREVLHTRPTLRNEGRGGTYAGSRPASGLSRRTSAFRGPPPSYFRHGDNAQQSSAAGGARQTYAEGNYGPSSSFEQTGEFDSRPVYNTQTHEDMRRNQRREAAMAAAVREMEEQGDFWMRFVIVTTIVVAGVSVGTLVVGMYDGPRGGGMLRGDGTLRRKHGNGKLRGKEGD